MVTTSPQKYNCCLKLTNFVNYTWAGYKIDATKYPTLAAYEQRLLELPAVKKVMTAEKAEIEKMKK